MIAFKKVRLLKDGTLKPLFIEAKRPFVIGQRMESHYCPKQGFAPRSINGFGEDAVGGWHCTPSPKADWIADELASGEQRVWIICEMSEITSYQRPQGLWYLAHYITPLRIICKNEIEEINKKYEECGNNPIYQVYLESLISEEVYDNAVKNMVEDGWVLASSIGIRGTIINPAFKERIARIWNVDLNKKAEVTDPYYFCKQDGVLWFCWE